MRSPFLRFMKFTSVLSLSLAHGFNIVFVSFLGEKMKAFSKSLFRLSVAAATPKIKLFRKALVTCTVTVLCILWIFRVASGRAQTEIGEN
jgi:hypothetical protein